MKALVAALFAAFSFTAWAAPYLEQKVSLTARNVTAAHVLEQVAQRYGVKFVLSPKLQARHISIDVKDSSLKDVLDFLATEQNAKWEVKGEAIHFSSLN